MQQIIKTRARFSSFCYGCGETVNVGQTISKTEYIHPETSDIEIAWRHEECASEDALYTVGFKHPATT